MINKILVLFTFASVLFGFSQVNLDSNLVYNYEFNNNTEDSSPNAFHVVNASNFTFVDDRDGNANSAIFFNGTNSFLELPNDPALKPNFQFPSVFGLS